MLLCKSWAEKEKKKRAGFQILLWSSTSYPTLSLICTTQQWPDEILKTLQSTWVRPEQGQAHSLQQVQCVLGLSNLISIDNYNNNNNPLHLQAPFETLLLANTSRKAYVNTNGWTVNGQIELSIQTQMRFWIGWLLNYYATFSQSWLTRAISK